jgi:hypothetical protein
MNDQEKSDSGIVAMLCCVRHMHMPTGGLCRMGWFFPRFTVSGLYSARHSLPLCLHFQLRRR